MGIGPRIVNTEPSVVQAGSVKNETGTGTLKKAEIIFLPENPKYTFNEVILPKHILSSIKRTLVIREKSDLVFNDWGLNKTHKHSKKVGINLYGPPGTGKTMVAHAIADHFKKKLIVINYADVESKFVGETPKNLTKAFKAAEESDSILFFDEADAILSRRVTNMNNATDTSVNQTRSVMLTLLNDYQGIILFATNYISNFDPAFMRRILAHIQFELPDYDCRLQLFQKLIPSKLPTNVKMRELALEFDGISGSDISNAVLLAAFKGAQSGKAFVEHTYFVEALKEIKDSQKANQASYNITTKSKIVSEEYVKEQLDKQGGEY